MNSPPLEIAVKVINIQKKSLNILGLPLRQLKDEIIDIRPDIAIDLSPDYDSLAAYLCRTSRAKVSIAFANHQGDLAYNYQVAPHPSRVGLDRYRVLAKYIG